MPDPVQAPAGRGIRGGDVRVRAVVDVEQRPLAALEYHGVTAVQGVVEQQGGVHDVWSQSFGVGEQVLDGLVDLDGPAVEHLDQRLVLVDQGALHLAVQDRGVHEVLDPDADPGHLVAVGRADAAAGGPDLGLAQEALRDLVEGHVVGRDDVRVGADDQPRGVDAAGDQAVHLVEQHLEVDHDAVADHGHAGRRQDARRAAGAGRTSRRRSPPCGRRCCRPGSARRSRRARRGGRSPCPCPRRPTGLPRSRSPASVPPPSAVRPRAHANHAPAPEAPRQP